MESTSPFLAMQQVERQLKGLLRAIDTDSLNVAEQRSLVGLRQLLIDTKLDIRDYELSETREEQERKLREAHRRLDELTKSILAAGYVFGPADIAQLSAHIEQIKGWLE